MILQRVRFHSCWFSALPLSCLLGCEAPNPETRQATGGTVQAQTANGNIAPHLGAVPVRVAAVTRQPILWVMPAAKHGASSYTARRAALMLS